MLIPLGSLFGRPWASLGRLQAPFQLGDGTSRVVRGALVTILTGSSVLATPNVNFKTLFDTFSD